MMVSFEDIPVNFKNKIVLLDIDGTIVADSLHHMKVLPDTKKKVKELTKYNTVYLCTNKRTKALLSKVEEQLGLKIINTKYKKPNLKILNDIPKSKHKSVIVIGDKMLTDGIFALLARVPFIPVKRKTDGNERLFVKFVYIADTILYRLLHIIKLI